MRLNGKQAIMSHVAGVKKTNTRAWLQIRLRYGTVIYVKKACGKIPRYWCLSEDLDAIDRAQSITVHDLEYTKLTRQVTTTKHHIVETREREHARMVA